MYLKVFFILFLISSLYSINDNYWIHKEKIKLKKDAFYTAWIYKDRGSNKEYKKILYFRWTLFHNEVLIMHLNLEKFNHQFTLKQEVFLDSFKLDIFDSYLGSNNPFLFIKFISFDKKTSEVTFMFFIRDEFGSIEVKLLK